MREKLLIPKISGMYSKGCQDVSFHLRKLYTRNYSDLSPKKVSKKGVHDFLAMSKN